MDTMGVMPLCITSPLVYLVCKMISLAYYKELITTARVLLVYTIFLKNKGVVTMATAVKLAYELTRNTCYLYLTIKLIRIALLTQNYIPYELKMGNFRSAYQSCCYHDNKSYHKVKNI